MEDVDVGGRVVVIFVEEGCGCDGSVGVELRVGDDTFKVDVSSSFISPTVVEGSNGLPSSMSCTSAGRLEADRNSKTFETV